MGRCALHREYGPQLWRFPDSPIVVVLVLESARGRKPNDRRRRRGRRRVPFAGTRCLPKKGGLTPLRRSQGLVLFLAIPGPRTNPCGHPWPKPRRPSARWSAPSEGSWLERSKCKVPATFLAMAAHPICADHLPHPGTFRPFQPLRSPGCNQRDEGRRG
jgi:hypothetical protein